MPETQQFPQGRTVELTVVVLLLSTVLLIDPLLSLWATASSHWLTPYAIWALIIVLGWLLQRKCGANAV